MDVVFFQIIGAFTRCCFFFLYSKILGKKHKSFSYFFLDKDSDVLDNSTNDYINNGIGIPVFFGLLILLYLIFVS